MIRGLELCAAKAGGSGLILGQGTRTHLLQQRVHRLPPKTRHSQINVFLKKGFQCICFKTNTLTEKEIRLVLSEIGLVEGELDEGGHKIQASHHKKKKH